MSVDRNEIEKKVKNVIQEQLGIEGNEINPESNFIDDLGADSLDTVEIVMTLEEEFGLEIPDEEAEQITTVKATIDYITNALS